MDALDAVVPLLAVAAPTVVVLREIAAFDRPPGPVAEPGPVADPEVAAAERPVVAALPEAAPAVVAAVQVEGPPVEEPVEEPPVEAEPAPDEPESMLAGLTTTETEERSLWRRVRALVVVIVLTLLTAALVGAGIYRAVSRLG